MLSTLMSFWNLRAMLFLMGVVSPRAFADAALKQELLAKLGATCPTPTVGLDNGYRCVVGQPGCLDDAKGQEILQALRKGCEEGRGGEGAPCLYGIYITKEGKVTAICGPRMLDARK